MPHQWMKLVALAAFFALVAACSTLDEDSASGKTGQLTTSDPSEAKSVNCKLWNTELFFRHAGVGDVTWCLRAGAKVNARNNDGATPLHHAAWNNNLPAVLAVLLSAGAEVSARTRQGATPLSYAAYYNENPAIITALLKAGADVNAQDISGRTPLHHAAQGSKTPGVVAALLKGGADVNARDEDDYTPLHHAARWSETPGVMATLLDAGTDLNARDETGLTPLHHAARGSETPGVVAALLDACADLNARDISGLTALHHAAQESKTPGVVAALLKGGADVNARDEDDHTPLYYAAQGSKTPGVVAVLLKAGADVNARDKTGETPLHKAARYSKAPNIVAVLLKGGADPAAKDEMGKTPQDYAEKNPFLQGTEALRRMIASSLAKKSCVGWNTSRFFFDAGAEEVARCLEAGAKVGARDEKQLTPLHHAVHINPNPGVTALLLKAGADVNARDIYGGTTLHFALFSQFQRNPAVIALLLKAGADPNARTNQGATPLHFALIYQSDAEVIKALLKAGVDVNAKFEGYTALHVAAAQHEDPAVIALLVKAGAMVDARGKDGETPLHVAAKPKGGPMVVKGENPAVIEALLDAGANPKASDEQGRTPWDYVKENPVFGGTEAFRRMKKAAGGQQDTDKPKELREIRVSGTYYSGDPKEIKSIEEYYRERGTLKEGETLADIRQLAHKLEYLGKERFYTGSKGSFIYCYGKITDKHRESAVVFNLDLRARMYDREGNLLAEDILRDRNPGRHPFATFAVAYLPYLNNGDVILRFVRLKGDKEIVLYELKNLHSHEHLLEHERSKNPYGYRLDKYNNTYCHM